MKGRAHVFDRDDIDTDLIIPAKYLNTDDPAELSEHAMEFVDIDFPKKVKAGDIVVGGRNFGCGSSREHAVWAFTGKGVQAVIADSFARIFFRNCINYGLFPVVCVGASKKIADGDVVEIDVSRGVVKNITKGEEYKSKPLPKFAQDIVNAGGLLPYVKKSLKEKSKRKDD